MRKFSLLAKIAITAVLFWLLLRHIPLEELQAVVREVDPRFVALGSFFLMLQPLIAAVRWLMIYRHIGGPATLSQAVGITYVGTLFGQVLPATVGSDFIRIWLCHRLGFPMSTSLNSVGLDHVAMFLGLVLAVAVGAAAGLADNLGTTELTLTLSGLLIVGTAGIAGVVAAEGLPESWRRWRIVRGLVKLAKDTRRVLFDPRMAFGVVTLSMAGFANMALTVYLFGHAVNAPFQFQDALLLVPLALLVSSIPISIGGWGSREVAMVAGLGMVGVPSSAALVVSLMFGVVSIAVSLPGVYYYFQLRRNLALAK